LKPSISNSLNCGHLAASQSAGCIAKFMNIMWCCLWKWSGWNRTNRTGGYGAVYIYGEIRRGEGKCK